MKIKPFLNENFPQSTRRTGSIILSTWRPFGLLLNNITTDRRGVVDEIRSSSSESRVFAVFSQIYQKNYLSIPQVREVC